MMGRRSFLTATGASLLGIPRAVGAQGARTYRIAYVAPSPGPTPITDVFRKALAGAGYTEGRNLVIEYRWMAGRESEYPAVLGALAGKVDVALVYGDVGIAAARRIADTTPIVFVNAVDPVVLGVVQSLARSGGNMTGISNAESELIRKRLEVLKEIAPRLSRCAALVDPASNAAALNVRETHEAGRILGVASRGSTWPRRNISKP